MPIRQNIVLLNCHDLGRFLGCYGVGTVRTPNLDALAGDGVLLRDAFCAAPQCSPSRAALFTGRYPHATGVLGLTHGHFGWDLKDDERHLAQQLRAAGYRTGLVGVQHESSVGRDPEAMGARLGFDEVLPRGTAEQVSERAIGVLRQWAGGDPFYLQVGYTEPHRQADVDGDPSDAMGFLGGYLASDDSRGVTVPGYLLDDPGGREEMAEIQGAVHYLDAAVGRVLDEITRLGLAESTIVVFTTDHGLALPRAKCSLYDPGLEIALILRSPRLGWSGGRTVDGLVSNVDVVPSLLEAVGLPVGPQVQGRSFLPVLQGSGAPRTEVFGQLTYHLYYDPCRCIRTDHHKLIVNFSNGHGFMDPTQSWRPRATPKAGTFQTRAAHHPPVELYDLTADPYELTDLAEDAAYADLRERLLAQLYEWMAQVADPLLSGPVAAPIHDLALRRLRAAAGSTTRG